MHGLAKSGVDIISHPVCGLTPFVETRNESGRTDTDGQQKSRLMFSDIYYTYGPQQLEMGLELL